MTDRYSIENLPTFDQIASQLKGWDRRRLERQLTGGKAFQDGFLYEFQYSVFRLVECLGQVERDEDLDRYYVLTGCVAFVDDVLVRDRHGLTYSQLKSGRVAWGRGPGSLSNSFLRQQLAMANLDWNARLELVVGVGNAESKLRRDRAENKLLFVEVRLFERAEHIHLLADNGRIRPVLDKLVEPFQGPLARRAAVQQLGGAWLAAGLNGTLRTVLELALDSGARFATPDRKPLLAGETYVRLDSLFILSFARSTLSVVCRSTRFKAEMPIAVGGDSWARFEDWLQQNEGANSYEVLLAAQEIADDVE